jgi:hypothetical protein
MGRRKSEVKKMHRQRMKKAKAKIHAAIKEGKKGKRSPSRARKAASAEKSG